MGKVGLNSTKLWAVSPASQHNIGSISQMIWGTLAWTQPSPQQWALQTCSQATDQSTTSPSCFSADCNCWCKGRDWVQCNKHDLFCSAVKAKCRWLDCTWQRLWPLQAGGPAPPWAVFHSDAPTHTPWHAGHLPPSSASWRHQTISMFAAEKRWQCKFGRIVVRLTWTSLQHLQNDA